MIFLSRRILRRTAVNCLLNILNSRRVVSKVSAIDPASPTPLPVLFGVAPDPEGCPNGPIWLGLDAVLLKVCLRATWIPCPTVAASNVLRRVTLLVPRDLLPTTVPVTVTRLVGKTLL